jgi:glycosyltransferase involved in cell wall biosynthesis
VKKIDVVVGVNCTGVGIGTLTRELENDLKCSGKDLVYFGPSVSGHCPSFLKTLYSHSLLLRYMVCFAYVLFNQKKINQIIVLANYWPFLSFIKTKIIVRHPYLLDEFIDELSLFEKIKEFFRRVVFKASCVNDRHIIIQTETMKNKLIQSNLARDCKIHIVPNPVRDLSSCDPVILPKYRRLFFYPSGYYPHKNFEILVDKLYLSRDFCKQNGFVLVFPINVARILSERSSTLVDMGILICTGPLKPEQMNYIYSLLPIILFPSKRETFGNGLYEAAQLKLPCIYSAELLSAPLNPNFFGVDFRDFDFSCFNLDLLRDVSRTQFFVDHRLDTHNWFSIIQELS